MNDNVLDFEHPNRKYNDPTWYEIGEYNSPRASCIPRAAAGDKAPRTRPSKGRNSAATPPRQAASLAPLMLSERESLADQSLGSQIEFGLDAEYEYEVASFRNLSVNTGRMLSYTRMHRSRLTPVPGNAAATGQEQASEVTPCPLFSDWSTRNESNQTSALSTYDELNNVSSVLIPGKSLVTY